MIAAAAAVADSAAAKALRAWRLWRWRWLLVRQGGLNGGTWKVGRQGRRGAGGQAKGSCYDLKAVGLEWLARI
jgi:hypothetical protein